MLIPTESCFARWIAQCRSDFDRSRTGLLWRLGLRPHASDADGVAGRLRPHYQVLAAKGRVVWGAVAQVNMNMFTAGGDDLPGVTVYSLDGYYDGHPQDLAVVGRACFQFKNTAPADVDFRPVADRLTDEFDQTARMPVPRRLSDGREVFLGATEFHRARLPGRVLRANVFPLVIAPESTEINMVLPLAHWPPALCEAWDDLQGRLAECPVTSAAQRVAGGAEKRLLEHSGPIWDAVAVPVYVTPAMSKELVAQAGQFGLTEQTVAGARRVGVELRPMLSVGLRPDGGRTAHAVLTHDPHTEQVFTSNGVSVVIRRDQLEQLRGAVIGFKSSAFATGVVIRLPGD